MSTFTINTEQAKKNYTELCKALPDALIAYAIKANYDKKILATLAREGCLAEACSDYEHKIAEKAGFKKVIRNGYGRLRKAWLTNAETIEQREQIKGLIGARLRLDPKSKLGIDEKDIIKHKWDCIGVHTRENLKQALNKAEEIAQQTEAEYVDAGGGLREELDKERINTLKTVKHKLIIEPGRYLVANACEIISKVLAVKEDKLIIDCGMNILNKFSDARYTVKTLKTGTKNHAYKIYGPIPTDIDNIGTHNLPEMKKGDEIIIGNAGAYTLSLSSNWVYPKPRIKYVARF